MAHYAKVNNGIVEKVIVAEPEFFDNFVDTSPGTWIQTSYNTIGGIHYSPETNQPDGGVALRGNYAGIGYIYDSINDVFYPPRPVDRNNISCASWTISSPTWTWNPPVEYPNNSRIHAWDEPTKTWIEVKE